MKNNPEILAPAGSLETLYAAIHMGADAVYVGAPRFGARAFADNPSVSELERAILDCHIRGKRLYLTVNTLLTDEELESELLPMMDPLVAAGLDAAIVQDPGVMLFLHETFPSLDLHASTQMALFSGAEAERLRPYGITRFVPARELSINEIRSSRAETDLEIEVFVHGALCVCYSGWCLMSEHIGGRSGNRGMCAGPCRLPYRWEAAQTDPPSFALNARDIETLLYIPELMEAGIDSFKIEGRMKNKEYAAFMAGLYRHYVDVYLEEGADHYRTLVEDRGSRLWCDRERAMELYNRGGFFPGFLFNTDSDTIETQVKGHYGLPVGQVEALSRKDKKTTAGIRLSAEVNPQDVLAIRNKNGEVVYEFTTGRTERDYYEAPVGHSEIRAGDGVFRTKNKCLLDEIDRRITKAAQDSTVVLTGCFTGKINEPVRLSIEGKIDTPQGEKTIRTTVEGETPVPAEKRPVTADEIRKRLMQLGETGYRFEELEIAMDDGVFLPLSAIKDIRRRAIEAWEKDVFLEWRVPEKGCDTAAGSGVKQEIKTDAWMNWIRVLTMEQWESVTEALRAANPRKTVLHVKLEGFPSTTWSTLFETEIPGVVKAFSLPRAFRGEDRARFTKEWQAVAADAGAERIPGDSIFMANSMASLVFRDSFFPGQTTVADENLYMTNARARQFYRELGVTEGPKRRYGRIPVMTTAHAIREGTPVTPKGDRFIVVKPHACGYRVVYTAEPVTDKSGSMIDFSTESSDTVREVLKQWMW